MSSAPAPKPGSSMRWTVARFADKRTIVPTSAALPLTPQTTGWPNAMPDDDPFEMTRLREKLPAP